MGTLKTDASASLKEAISILEIRQAEEGKLLKEHLILVYEKMKPFNLIKSTFDDIASVMENRKGLVNSLVGILTGYVTQKLVVGSKAGLFKKMTGVLLNYGIAAFVSKYAEPLKVMGLQLLSQFVGQKHIENSELAQDNKA
jgi:hypothetical protein